MTDLIDLVKIVNVAHARNGDYVVEKEVDDEGKVTWAILAMYNGTLYEVDNVAYPNQTEAWSRARHLRAVLVHSVLNTMSPAEIIGAVGVGLERSQADVALLMGVGQGMVSQWLTGASGMRRTARMLALRTWGAMLG